MSAIAVAIIVKQMKEISGLILQISKTLKEMNKRIKKLEERNF